jgi:hypothetical protein
MQNVDNHPSKEEGRRKYEVAGKIRHNTLQAYIALSLFFVCKYLCSWFSEARVFNYTGCPKSLEPRGVLIIFLIFIYRLKLKVKKLNIALTLDERVETLHFGDS